MRWRCISGRIRQALLALWLGVLPLAPAAAAARVVSLNLCTDQMLVLLAPQRIAALSLLARDPALSVVAAAARRFPVVRADAESVLRLHPDLVLAGTYGAQAALAVLRAAGVHVVQFEDAQDFADIRAMWREAGGWLDAEPRAEALLRGMDAQLAAIAPRGRRLRAILWQAHGFSSAPGTLGDAVLRAAGFRNAGGGVIDVERMAARPPDLLVEEAAPDFPSLATDMLLHPAVAAIPRRTVPAAWLACGTPQTAAASALLAQ